MAKKSLGQHWLQDAESLQGIIAFANLTPHDTVLEIGPGRGDLTRYLLNEVDTVVAVEVDPDMVDHLIKTLPAEKLFLVHEDIMTFDFARLPNQYKIVANIPYYITSSIIRLLLESAQPARSATLLVQKEVAERMAAQPGQLSVLAISVQLYADIELGPIIRAQKFEPAPKVDSQVIRLDLLNTPRFDVDQKQFFRMVKAGFSARRKKLKSALSGGLNLPKEEIITVLESVKIDPDTRAQDVSIESWHKLYNKLYS